MLYKCARSGFYDLTKELLKFEGMDVNIRQRSAGSTPLHAACFYGHMPVVSLLVAKGADINLKNRYGSTPLDEMHPKLHSQVEAMVQQMSAAPDTEHPHIFAEAMRAGVAISSTFDVKIPAKK